MFQDGAAEKLSYIFLLYIFCPPQAGNPWVIYFHCIFCQAISKNLYQFLYNIWCSMTIISRLGASILCACVFNITWINPADIHHTISETPIPVRAKIYHPGCVCVDPTSKSGMATTPKHVESVQNPRRSVCLRVHFVNQSGGTEVLSTCRL